MAAVKCCLVVVLGGYFVCFEWCVVALLVCVALLVLDYGYVAYVLVVVLLSI